MKGRIRRLTSFVRLFLAFVFFIFLVLPVEESRGVFPCNNINRKKDIQTDKNVKNLILLIGDGMGLAQITAGRIKIFGADGRLFMDEFPVVGLVTTHSANNLITDSAAAATAIATGYKTNNGMISVAPDGRRLYTILEACKDKGMAVGLVVTSTITHATPAAFASHVISRKEEPKIASQLIENKIDLLLGGGLCYFIPQTSEGSKRGDDLDLISKAEDLGYRVVKRRKELFDVQGGMVLGLFQFGPLTGEDPEEPTLAEMTQRAIEILNQNDRGFFLMVEGSQIDWACHDNDTDNMLRQVRSFDEAVRVAIEFAIRDAHTLVVVTADHECGGASIVGGSLDGKELDIAWTSKKHTGVMVPVFAYGPGAGRFAGIYDNTRLAYMFAELLGIDFFPRKLEMIEVEEPKEDSTSSMAVPVQSN